MLCSRFFRRTLPRALLRRLAGALLAAVLGLAASGGAVFAQTEAVDAEALAADRVEALIDTLESETERAALVETLRTLLEAQRQAPPAGGAGDAAEGASPFERRVLALFRELDDGSAIAAWVAGQASDAERRALWLQALWQAALALGAGVVALLAVRRFASPRLERLRRREEAGWVERPLIGAGVLALRVAPVAAFAGAGYAAMLALTEESLARAACLAAIKAVALTLLAAAVARAVLVPLSPQLRVLPLGDRQAAYLAVWLRRFATVGVFGFVATDLLAGVGLPPAGAALLERLVGLALAAMAIVLVMQGRQPVAAWIRDRESGGGALRNGLSDIWHVLAVIAVAMVFVAWALRVERSFAFLLEGFAVSGLALFGALLASALGRRLLHRTFRVSADLAARFPGLETRANRYLSAAGSLLNAVVWLVALAVALEAWGVDALGLALSAMGLDVIGRVVSVVVVAAVAIVAWELGDGAIASYLRRGEQGALSPRLQTLLPLVRNVLLVVIATIAAITVLAEIGLDIAPLLAGAGVVGLAIGFGAQTLVKDVITGAFVLFEDQFSVGDWIDVGGKMGGVESITIRTVRLRDLNGYIHTIPFGQISAVTNMMRDFGYAVIDVGIAYQENTDRVIEALREIDAEARRDPEIAECLSGDLEVLGVNALGDSSVTVRVRVRTLPGYQWGVRRNYLRLIKLRFDELGIEIPFPHMTVYFGEIRGGRTAPAMVRIDAADPVPAPARASEATPRGSAAPD